MPAVPGEKFMIVVTGGAGFIGSNLVAALGEKGFHDVVVCDRLGAGEKWRNLLHHEVMEILEPGQLMDFLRCHKNEIQMIFHLGATSSTTATDARLVLADNFSFSVRLWDWAAESGCRLIYASSAATYGDGSAGFLDDISPEHLARLRPLNLYGWSKHLFDRRVARRVRRGDALPPQWAGLKFFNVYGPNEYHKTGQWSVVLQAFRSAQSTGRIRLFRSTTPGLDDGEQKRDFIWVEDCVPVMLWLLDHPEVNGLFNVGTGRAQSFNELARAVFAALGRDVEIEYFDMSAELRERYQSFTQARLDRLREAGYNLAFTPLEDGVATYVQRYLQAPDPYR
jgi:ADP-L-glycero-D-manno-heptose 6-epimerase